MKTYNMPFFVVLFALTLIFSVSSCAETAPKFRIAVMNATDDAKLLKQSDLVANNFIRVMAKSEAFAVVEREELEMMKIKQKISDSQIIEMRTAAKLATIMGCQYFVLSSLVYNVVPIISIRVINAATSKIIFSDIEFSDESDYSSIIDASARLAYKFLEELTGTQSVISNVEGNEITINRGSLSGVRKGDLYLVYSGTKKKYDDVAIIKVKDVRMNFSYAELVKNAGKISLLRVNDTIMPVSREESNTIIRRKKFVSNRPAGELPSQPQILPAKLWQNYEECLKYAKQGNAKAQCDLGHMYLFGQEVKRDYAKAAEWYNKAAENGDFTAQFNLAMMYFKGSGVRQNYIKAAGLFHKSAEQGNIAAQNNLGGMYLHGYGVKQDYAKALELFRKAAEQGDAMAQNNLGTMYDKGYGMKQDYTKAVELYHKAAEQGLAEAQFNLGAMYENGAGVKQNYSKAVELYSKAAEQGFLPALANLGTLYFDMHNYVKAAELYRKGAEQGDAYAQNNLATLYLDGKGVKQDYKKAAELYRQAAEQGNAQAQYNLGVMYEYGDGVKQNRNKAIELYRKAARQGHEMAQQRLKKLGVK